MSATGFEGSSLRYTFTSPGMVGHDVVQDFTELPGADGDFLTSGQFDVGRLTVTNTTIRLDMNSSFGISFAPNDAIGIHDIGDNVPTIIGLSLSTNVAGLTFADITYTADSIFIIMPTVLDWFPSQFVEVTVSFQLPNSAPTFSGASRLTTRENTKVAGQIEAVDADGDVLTYSIVGGADSGQFTINNSTGALTFKAAPDFEQPRSAAGTNSYEVSVSVSDGTETSSRLYTVDVLDMPGDEPPSTYYGTKSNDQFFGTRANIIFQGDDGFDTVRYSGSRSNFTFSRGQEGEIRITDGIYEHVLRSIEKVEFSDGVLAFDLTDAATQIYRTYQASLNRAADKEGLDYWTSLLESGGASLTTIVDGFINSPEFRATFGTESTVSDIDFIELLYKNALGRDHDQSGLDYWLASIGSGQTNRNDLLTSFSESDENVARFETMADDGVWIL